MVTDFVVILIVMWLFNRHDRRELDRIMRKAEQKVEAEQRP